MWSTLTDVLIQVLDYVIVYFIVQTAQCQRLVETYQVPVEV